MELADTARLKQQLEVQLNDLQVPMFIYASLHHAVSINIYHIAS